MEGLDTIATIRWGVQGGGLGYHSNYKVGGGVVQGGVGS